MKMTIPNKLTILRMIFVIPFLATLALAITTNTTSDYDYQKWNQKTILFVTSGVIFVVAMLTDFIDGFLARKNNEITLFGKIFDPIADKIITTSALVMLSIARIIPFYISLVYILRDIVVDGTRMIAASNKIEMGASIWGKFKTTTMTIGLIMIFFLFPLTPFKMLTYKIILNIPLIIGALFSLFSGWKYIEQIIPFLKKSR